MIVDAAILDGLMFRSEDSSVEFKSEQYTFARLRKDAYPELSNAERARKFKEKKSELLKDILAMANGWRDGPGYILIGFKERKPLPPLVMGIPPDEYYDDSQLQQFIAGHANARLSFRYGVYEYRGVSVGVIVIPKQARPPFVATDEYGIVRRSVVYVRRGSATCEATPEEIAAMGAADCQQNRHAAVEVGFVGHDGAPLSEASPVLAFIEFDDVEALPDLRGDFTATFRRHNVDYWRELAAWKMIKGRAVELTLTLNNQSAFSLSDCKIELSAFADDGVSVPMLESRNVPKRPKHTIDILPTPDFQTIHDKKTLDIEGESPGERCIARMGKALPGERVTASEAVVLLPDGPGRILLQARILASEIPSPLLFEESFAVSGCVEQWDIERLVSFGRG